MAGLQFWTWNTEEVLDLIQWMRHYNAQVTNSAKVTFAGFDAQFTAQAATMLKAFLALVDPAFVAEISPRLVQFEKDTRDYGSLSDSDVIARTSTVQDVAERLRAEEPTYVARSTVQQWRLACQNARILAQVHEQRRAGSDEMRRYIVRDRAMAENVAWILENEGPRSKVVLWAHNAHVARDPRGTFDGSAQSMGMHLAHRFERDLVVVGFAFGEGAFQALVKEGRSMPLREVLVGPAAAETLDGVLMRTGIDAFLIDLRDVDGDAASWLQEPRVTREIGAFFEEPEDMSHTIVPMARYDLLAFIARTTRARPNPTISPA